MSDRTSNCFGEDFEAKEYFWWYQSIYWTSTSFLNLLKKSTRNFCHFQQNWEIFFLKISCKFKSPWINQITFFYVQVSPKDSPNIFLMYYFEFVWRKKFKEVHQKNVWGVYYFEFVWRKKCFQQSMILDETYDNSGLKWLRGMFKTNSKHLIIDDSHFFFHFLLVKK